MPERHAIDEITDELLKTLPQLGAIHRPSVRLAIRDAYELGSLSPKTVEEPKPLTPLGLKLGEARAGFVATAVNTFNPTERPEPAELQLMAWLQQGFREVAAAGANPLNDAAAQIVGMEDGTVVVTVEATVQ